MLTKSECNFFETFCSPIIEVDYVGLEVAPELPTKQYLDIRFVVDDERLTFLLLPCLPLPRAEE
jgi:hypothetical protein